MRMAVIVYRPIRLDGSLLFPRRSEKAPEKCKTKSIPFVPGDPPEGAPRKVRAMLRGNSAPFDSTINFTDIGNVVNAFKTIAYAEDGPTACP